MLVSAVPSSKCCFEQTGRQLFARFGEQPHSAVMLFTGMAFWIVLGIVLYEAFRSHDIQPAPAALPCVALMAQQHGNRPAREH
jgi:hypothetical protein